MMPVYEMEPQEAAPATPEQRLWLGALALLVEDARRHAEQLRLRDARDYEGEQAFDDLMRCGPMLRHLAERAGYDPQWISQVFKRSVGVR